MGTARAKVDKRWACEFLAAANESMLLLWQRLVCMPSRQLETHPEEKDRLASLIGKVQGKLLAADDVIADLTKKAGEK